MKKIFIVFPLLFIMLTFTSSAAAYSTINIYPGTATYIPPLQSWVEAPYDKSIPTPFTRVDVFTNGCPVNPDAACAVPKGFWSKPFPSIWLIRKYLQDDKESLRMTRKIFFHELGHVFDYIHLDDNERNAIISMFGYSPEIGWYGNKDAQPNELFAEGAASCWFGPNTPFQAYGYSYTYQEIQPLCRAMVGSYVNDTSWFGQRVVRAVSRVIKIKAKLVQKGAPVKWGGGEISIIYRNSVRWFYKCSGNARFGSLGSVSYNICGNNLQSRSTLPKPFKIRFKNIPTGKVR